MMPHVVLFALIYVVAVVAVVGALALIGLCQAAGKHAPKPTDRSRDE